MDPSLRPCEGTLNNCCPCEGTLNNCCPCEGIQPERQTALCYVRRCLRCRLICHRWNGTSSLVSLFVHLIHLFVFFSSFADNYSLVIKVITRHCRSLVAFPRGLAVIRRQGREKVYCCLVRGRMKKLKKTECFPFFFVSNGLLKIYLP